MVMLASGAFMSDQFLIWRNPRSRYHDKMMKDISDIVLRYGGAISGEHGDGLIRSWLNEKMFGEKIYRAFES